MDKKTTPQPKPVQVTPQWPCVAEALAALKACKASVKATRESLEVLNGR